MRDRPERNHAAHRAGAGGGARSARVRAGSRRSCPAGRIDRLSERRAEFARSSIAAHDTYDNQTVTHSRTDHRVRRRRVSVAIGRAARTAHHSRRRRTHNRPHARYSIRYRK